MTCAGPSRLGAVSNPAKNSITPNRCGFLRTTGHSICINAVDLKNVPRDIQTDRDNLHAGELLSWRSSPTTPFGTSTPRADLRGGPRRMNGHRRAVALRGSLRSHHKVTVIDCCRWHNSCLFRYIDSTRSAVPANRGHVGTTISASPQCRTATNWMIAGPMMMANRTGRKNRTIGTVSFGGSAAAFFSALLMRVSRLSCASTRSV